MPKDNQDFEQLKAQIDSLQGLLNNLVDNDGKQNGNLMAYLSNVSTSKVKFARTFTKNSLAKDKSITFAKLDFEKSGSNGKPPGKNYISRQSPRELV